MSNLTEAQQKFIALEKKKVEVKKYFDELENATKAVAEEVGIGGMFQDEQGTVYKIVIPSGRFVQFQHVGYVRTRRAYLDEKRGDLALKDAEEAGFEVPKK